jgi:hypothetical protein
MNKNSVYFLGTLRSLGTASIATVQPEKVGCSSGTSRRSANDDDREGGSWNPVIPERI